VNADYLRNIFISSSSFQTPETSEGYKLLVDALLCWLVPIAYQAGRVSVTDQVGLVMSLGDRLTTHGITQYQCCHQQGHRSCEQPALSGQFLEQHGI